MKTLQIIVTTLNLITKILEEKGLAQMKTPQELTVCVSLRLPISSLSHLTGSKKVKIWFCFWGKLVRGAKDS